MNIMHFCMVCIMAHNEPHGMQYAHLVGSRAHFAQAMANGRQRYEKCHEK